MPAQTQPGREAVSGQTSEPDGKATSALLDWLDGHRHEIVEEWVERLAVMSPSYRKQLTSDLFVTVGLAFKANLDVLQSGSKERIDGFIDYITEKRLRAGFPLSDVQKAFELFRILVARLLAEEGEYEILERNLEPVNSCLAYTIHKFSDHFQAMAELEIRRHAQDLERKVRLRTKELAESERKYKTLINEINDGYFIVQDGRLAFANQAFCCMHGAAWEGLAGKPFLDLVDPADRDKVRGALRRVMLRRHPGGQLEYKRLGCPSRESATEIKHRMVDLGKGPVAIGICRDISARVAMEAKIRKNERLAYVGHIAASLSHEIRNPLSTCTLNMLILRDKLNLDGFDRRRLEITVRELTRLEDILRQLLDLSRPLLLEPAPVDLGEVAADCEDLLAGKITEKSISLARHHRLGLSRVDADYDMMVQAYLNLMLNAVEAVDQGGRIHTWSRIIADDKGRWAELGVHDDGPGIGPEQRHKLFIPFSTDKSRGTGLGLSNVKRIMDGHGGHVKVKNSPGWGATFILRLPCERTKTS